MTLKFSFGWSGSLNTSTPTNPLCKYSYVPDFRIWNSGVFTINYLLRQVTGEVIQKLFIRKMLTVSGCKFTCRWECVFTSHLGENILFCYPNLTLTLPLPQPAVLLLFFLVFININIIYILTFSLFLPMNKIHEVREFCLYSFYSCYHLKLLSS